MIKKIVCAAIMTALLVSQAVCAMAATFPGVATTTKYTTDGIEVTTSVSVFSDETQVVEANDEITYLAYEGETVTDSNIAYIDQVTVSDADVENGYVAFTYVTDSKYLGATVKVGGMDDNTAEAYDVNEGTIAGTVAVKIDGADAVTVAMPETANGLTEIKCSSVMKDLYIGTTTETLIPTTEWFPSAEGFWISNKYLTSTYVTDGVVNFTWGTEAISTASETVVNKVAVNGNNLLILATKKGAETDFGVAVTTGETIDVAAADTVEEGTALTDIASKTLKFKALGCDDKGQFVIEIQGVAEPGTEDKTFIVGAYSGADVAEATQTLTVAKTEASEG